MTPLQMGRTKIFNFILMEKNPEDEIQEMLLGETNEQLRFVMAFDPAPAAKQQWDEVQAYVGCELERRDDVAARDLARRTTIVSGVIGVAAALVGAIVGALLAS